MNRNLCVLLTAVVGSSWSPAAIAQLDDPIPEPITKGTQAIELETVLDGITAPNYLTHPGDGSGRLMVVDQPGQIWLIDNGVPQAQPYLDASGLLVGLNPGFDERGLLGLAFHPDFENQGQPGHGKFYTYTNEPVSGDADFTVPIDAGTEFNNQAVVREWDVDPSDNQITGDPATISRELMRIDDPAFNHNAGQVTFGPDGMLYISIGDGGDGNDQGNGHTDGIGNAQDTSNIFGNMLRIDPLGDNSDNGQYGVPDDNPFVGDGDVLDEIYAYGLRNPFRFSFDVDPATGQTTAETTGRLIVGDVGQSDIEEVDIVEAGDNLGWRLKEGSFFFDPDETAVDTEPFDDIPIPGDFNPVDPVLEYDDDEGISVIGGFVYRGAAIPGLAGDYVFGDFTDGGFGTPAGRLFVGDLESGEIEELVIGTDDRPLGQFVKGFGRGPDGELYVMVGTDLGPTGNSGAVWKLVQVPEPASLALLLAAIGLVLAARPRFVRR